MKIAFVTGARSDWRLVEPVLRAAAARTDTVATLLVTGSHLSARHGRTVDAIRAAGWEPDACVEILEDSDTPLAAGRATGRAVGGFADALARFAPDWVVVVGDRYESFAAAVAATMLGIPLAHVAGGETDVATNQDCNLRNAMTKLAQLHLVAHEPAAGRVLGLGEEPWRVHVVGLPSLDGIGEQAADPGVLRPYVADAQTGTISPFLLVSYLPVTLRPEASLADLDTMLAALDPVAMRKLCVLSNADAGGDEHDRRVRAWAAGRPDVTCVANLDPGTYLAALKHCVCYVGNSSSGVIESPAFGTPAVIVGPRQLGRPLAENVRALVEPARDALVGAIQAQIAHGRYADVLSPFGDGGAAPRICSLLHRARTHPDLLAKRLIVPSRRRRAERKPAQVLA